MEDYIPIGREFSCKFYVPLNGNRFALMHTSHLDKYDSWDHFKDGQGGILLSIWDPEGEDKFFCSLCGNEVSKDDALSKTVCPCCDNVKYNDNEHRIIE